MLAARSVSVEGKKRWSLLLGTWRALLTTVALHSLLVHSLAHELAASPEATSRLLSSAERCLARSDEGGELGKGDDGNEGEAVVEALPLALHKWIVMNLLNDLIYSPGTLANLIVPSALLNLRTKAAILLIQEPFV